jgi:hypothetical protein
MTPIAWHRRSAVVLPALVLALGLAPPALAAWPHNPLASLLVCPTSSNQDVYCTPVSDGAGGLIIVWVDDRNGTRDIYAQRLNSQGVAQWASQGVAVCTAANDQTEPVAVSDGGSGVVIAWQDMRSGISSDIYAQKVNQSGQLQWTATGVPVCTAAGTQSAVEIAPDSAGGAIIGWNDSRFGDVDTYAQRVSTQGLLRWTSGGVAVCSTAGTQDWLGMVSDGAGGAILSWRDQRSGGIQIYAQRVNGSGAAQWTAQGVRLATSTASQWSPRLATDGAGGAIVVWHEARSAADYDVYAQHVTTSGTLLWSTGILACVNSASQQSAMPAADGSGGVLLAWQDERGTDWDIYAQHLDAGGGLCWATSGAMVCNSLGTSYLGSVIPDGAGGLIAAWNDNRNTTHYDGYAQRIGATGVAQWTHDGIAVSTLPGGDNAPYVVANGTGGAFAVWTYIGGGKDQVRAQRVDRFGMLGAPEPEITQVTDVPHDQGGQVQVEWTASYLDTFPVFDIAQYTVWRRVPNALAQAEGGPIAPGAVARLRDGRVIRAGVQGTQAVYWQLVGTQAARGLPGYSYVAATTSDSLPGANPYTSFMVMAEESGGIPYWMSAADSGYSVDNLAPPTPSPFTGTYTSGTSYLQWGASPVSDFAEFRLHRGHTAGFTPDAGNLVVAQSGAGYVDAAGGPCYYQLCAVDVHGNVSPYAFLQPSGTADTPVPALPRELALSPPAPNPLRGSATLTLALPRAADVTLAIFDQQGRRVRTLVSGARPAGEHAIVWDGRDDAGHAVVSGIYFVRCEVAGRTITRRIVALR